jgi:5-formyltetrahydrofolate cyclo-ligase
MKKSELRSFYKQKRLELTPSELIHRSSQICERLFANFQLQGKTISLFLPIERQKEINTYEILEKGISISTRIGIPKSNLSNSRMIHYMYESPTQLQLNELGIPEPTSGEIIKDNEFDYVLVPLLAIDSSGHRVGYGKGFYDRFLENCSSQCVKIGIHLFEDFEDIDDVSEHDVALDICITPLTIYRFDRK